jgi:hypothetical protein
VSDDAALGGIFTPQVVWRLQSLDNKTKAQLPRVYVLTCGDGTGLGMMGPDLVTFRDAWARYLACAFRVGLFDGANGSDLRARLTGTDDDNFISAMNECLATWFLADHLALSVTPRPSGKSRSVLELAITLPDGQIFVEVKGLIRPITLDQMNNGSSGIRVGDLGPILAAPARYALDLDLQVLAAGPHSPGGGLAGVCGCTSRVASTATSHRPLL